MFGFVFVGVFFSLSVKSDSDLTLLALRRTRTRAFLLSFHPSFSLLLSVLFLKASQRRSRVPLTKISSEVRFLSSSGHLRVNSGAASAPGLHHHYITLCVSVSVRVCVCVC